MKRLRTYTQSVSGALPVGFVSLVGLALLSGSASASNLPESCADILASDPGASDGNYTIYPNNNTQILAVFCAGMQDDPSMPAEYLSLINNGGPYNFSQYTAGGASLGADVKTSYTKIRLDPATLLVDISDQTFATSAGSLTHSGSTPVTSMPYGVAMSCDQTDSGRANIDLTGSFLAVIDPFITSGFQPKGGATFVGDQVVNLTGGGFCGYTSSDPAIFNPFNTAGGFQLDLAYIGPTFVHIDIKPSDDPNSINSRSGGVTPVAILSSASWSAPLEVDTATLKFGPNGDEQSLAFCDRGTEDVNGDGFNDLVCHFNTQLAGFQIGDTQGVLTGNTFSGDAFMGMDSVRIVR